MKLTYHTWELKNYNSTANKTTTVTGKQIPTVTTVTVEEGGIVGKAVKITANIVNDTSADDKISKGNVPQGYVEFTYNGVLIGNQTVTDGKSIVNVVFNNTITEGTIIASYHDDNGKYNDSHSSESNKNLNIAKGATVIEVTPEAHNYTDENVTIEVVVKDSNTGNVINSGKVNVNGQSCDIVEGKVVYNYTVTTTSPVNITSYFECNNDYNESEPKNTTVTKDLIPTETTVDAISGIVGVPVTITAHVVDLTIMVDNVYIEGGSVTFKLGDKVLGTNSTVNGNATITVLFNNSISDAKVVAYYTNGSVKYADSDSSNSGNNIVIGKGATEISVTPTAHNYVGSNVTIEVVVRDKNTGNVINSGKVNVNGESCDIVGGKVVYNYIGYLKNSIF